MTKMILQVEDVDEHILFMRLAMESAKVENPVMVARDGLEAVDYIEGKGKFADRKKFPLPALVLLDLGLPFVPGLEVLKLIRKHPELATVPVIILSSSNQDRDVETAYDLGADAYIVKPGYTELQDVARLLKKYWLDRDRPPPNCQDWLSVTVRPGHNPPRQ